MISLAAWTPEVLTLIAATAWMPLAAISPEGIAERLISTAIIALVIGVGGAWVGVRLGQKDVANLAARLDRQDEEHAKRMGEIEADIKLHAEAIGTLRTERANCELWASREYVTKDELVRVANENVQLRRDLIGRLDDVHTRVSATGETLGELKGQIEGMT